MDTRRWNLPSSSSGRQQRPSLRRTPLETSFSQCCQSAGAGQNLQAFSQTTWTGFKSSFISSRHVQFRQHQYVASEGTTSRFSFFFFFYMQQETRQDVSQTGRGRLKDTVCATIRTRTIKKNNRFQDEFCIVCAGCYLFIYTLCVYSFAFLSRVESMNSRCRASVTQRPLVAVHCTPSPRPPRDKSLVNCNQNLMGCRETSQRPTGTEPRSPLRLKKKNQNKKHQNS